MQFIPSSILKKLDSIKEVINEEEYMNEEESNIIRIFKIP
jgi:hypothetical protein